MIHYHTGPLGGSNEQAARFWIGRHGLLSFAYPETLPIIAECCQSFALDNGAFTSWKQRKPLDLDGFAKWVGEWFRHPGFDWHLAPDVIDGSEAENDRLLAAWTTGYPGAIAKPVPVWHLHESIARLQRLCGAFPTVALGSSGQWATPGTDGWWQRMSEAMTAICDENGRPMCKLHGLRMLSPDIFQHLPLASADSTNAARNSRGASKARFGIYPPPTVWERAAVIADRVETYNSAAAWTADAWQYADLLAGVE